MSLLRPDAWLSNLFERPVFQVSPVSGGSPADTAAALSSHAGSQQKAFYYAKVDVGDVATVAALGAAGMVVVDVNVTFAAASGSAPLHPAVPGIDIREAGERDADAVLKIAETAFRYSRFHLDPLISDRLANRIKREWIASYLAKRRGERLWIARTNNRTVGFLAIIAGDQRGIRHRTIDLIAVAPAAHRAGVGRELVRFFLREYAPHCDRLSVGTQIANMPSVRMYQQSGMLIDGAQYVLHMHVPESMESK